MGWLTIKDQTVLVRNKTTHSVVNYGKPPLMAELIAPKQPPRSTRLTDYNQIGNRPNKLGRSAKTKNTYRYKTYEEYNKLPGCLTSIKSKSLFSKRLKRYLHNNTDLPKNNLPITT